MEFKSLKNIETSFRQIRLFCIVLVIGCAVVAICSVVFAFRFAEKQREKIYVLDGGKSLMLALSQDLSQNRPAEAREHVRRFHELFFTLSPEKSAIEHNVKRALLLADKSAYNYYQDFAEKGFYNRLIAGNINQSLQVDSVVCNFDNYPYQAKTYARQVILRESNVTERSLVTVCRLVNATRSDDNPNGFTIEGFTIVENRDISTVERYKTIQEKVNGMKGRLRDRLDSLPPRVRLKVVLVMFGLFALCSLYMIGSAIINFGNGKTSNIEVEHIESVKLPTDKGQQVTNLKELIHGEGEE